MRNYKCRDNNNIQSNKRSDDCVCDVVRRIVDAQDKVGVNGCFSGCDRSIRQLHSQKDGNNLGPVNTTIPFILYCGGTCEPFIGSGIYKMPGGPRGGASYGCIETPIFRAKSFVKGSGCCVRLELLVPVSAGCETSVSTDTQSTICPFFPTDNPVTDFQATGICLTVNLENFLAISCLDPITPIPY